MYTWIWYILYKKGRDYKLLAIVMLTMKTLVIIIPDNQLLDMCFYFDTEQSLGVPRGNQLCCSQQQKWNTE